jgi:hypothetical protein
VPGHFCAERAHRAFLAAGKKRERSWSRWRKRGRGSSTTRPRAPAARTTCPGSSSSISLASISCGSTTRARGRR